MRTTSCPIHFTYLGAVGRAPFHLLFLLHFIAVDTYVISRSNIPAAISDWSPTLTIHVHITILYVSLIIVEWLSSGQQQLLPSLEPPNLFRHLTPAGYQRI